MLCVCVVSELGSQWMYWQSIGLIYKSLFLSPPVQHPFTQIRYWCNQDKTLLWHSLQQPYRDFTHDTTQQKTLSNYFSYAVKSKLNISKIFLNNLQKFLLKTTKTTVKSTYWTKYFSLISFSVHFTKKWQITHWIKHGF